MHRLMLLAALAATAGCTVPDLERRTIGQSKSLADLRFNQVLQCLAAVADDPAALPTFSLIESGTVTVRDSVGLGATTTWSRFGFLNQTLGGQVGNNPQQNWTLSTVAEPDRLAAFRAACRWIIEGPQTDKPGGSILTDPDTDPSPGHHFDLERQLSRLPPGWLQIGGRRDVPHQARYKAHCGHTWVWVMPEGMKGLSGFTLIMLDIATVQEAALVRRIVDARVRSAAPRRLLDGVIDDPTNAARGRVLEVDELRLINPLEARLLANFRQAPGYVNRIVFQLMPPVKKGDFLELFAKPIVLDLDDSLTPPPVHNYVPRHRL